MYITLALAAATALPSPVGRTLHYVRSNADGSRPEQIYIHRPSADRVEVYKMVERCTHAALVTADIDPATGEAHRLEAASLLPGAQREPYGTIAFDPAAARLTMTLTGSAPVSVSVTARPWHLYDYDLGTLVAGLQAAQPERIAFGMALVWVEDDRPVLRWLGAAMAQRGAATHHRGRPAWRYEVSGPAFGTVGGGPMRVDRRDGTLIEANWRLPNHAGYRDFRLRLVAEEPAGADAWRALLIRQHAGCPPA